MKFNGFEVTPLGNATLQILENKLVVSNIGDSGLDGIQVRTEGWKRATVHLDPLPNLIDTEGVVKKTALVKDGLDRVFTESEQVIFYYPPLDKILIGYNSNLTPRGSRFIGRLNGNIVFDFDVENLEPVEQDMPFIWGIVAIVAIVASTVIALVAIGSKVNANVDSKSTTTTNADGSKTETTETSTSLSADPQPFSITVNNVDYTIDEYGIEKQSTTVRTNPTVPNINVIRNAAVQVSASKITSFTVNSIEGIN